LIAQPAGELISGAISDRRAALHGSRAVCGDRIDFLLTLLGDLPIS
jgi:hypothetical protein